MRWLKGVLVKAAAAIFPWAPRHERQAAIAAATAEKEQSRAGKEHATAIAAELRQMTRNGYAAEIAGQIIEGHHRRRRLNGG